MTLLIGGVIVTLLIGGVIVTLLIGGIIVTNAVFSSNSLAGLEKVVLPHTWNISGTGNHCIVYIFS